MEPLVFNWAEENCSVMSGTTGGSDAAQRPDGPHPSGLDG